MRYLGVDYGRKHVGLAISDADGLIALPLIVINNEPRLPAILSQICRQEGAAAVIIGRSLDYRRRPNPLMTSILELKDQLETEHGLPVHLEDEFLTTQEAKREISSLDRLAHARAAALILRSFLETQRHA